MLKFIPVLATCAVLAAAHAQTIYKCTSNGQPSYSDRPCADGIMTQLAAPRAPAPDPETAKRLARQQTLARQFDARDRALAQRQALRDEQASERARRLATAQKTKCDRLRLRQQWAQEDVRRATPKTGDSARIKARRQQEIMALECPS